MDLISIAKNVALTGQMLNKHGAVAFDHGRKIALCSATNSHDLFGRGDLMELPSIHAECKCLHILQTPRIYHKNKLHLHNHSLGRRTSSQTQTKTKTKRRKKLNILVIRINGEGKLGNSRPCASCIEKMKTFGIYRVYYSDNTGKIIWEKLTEIINDHISIGGRIKNTRYVTKSFFIKRVHAVKRDLGLDVDG